MSSLNRTLKKVTSSEVAELRFRLYREIKILQERFGFLPRLTICSESSRIEGLPLLGFEKHEETVRSFFSDQFPEEMERTVTKANKLLEHRFDLLGLEDLTLGEEIDWCREPLVRGKIPLYHWSKIERITDGSLVDLKIVWELNRHQYFIALGQAYFLTKDSQYAEEIVNQILHWKKTNPPGRGANWASSLEVAFRLVSWIWAVKLIKESECVDDIFLRNLAAWVGEHARHIERFLSTYSSPNTHLTGEALGLFYAGVFFPNLPEAARWRRKGEEILFNMLPVHLLPDGGYVERTLWYHQYTVSFYIHFFILMKKMGREIPDWAWKRVQEGVSFLMYSLKPDRTMPMIGDDDGGYFLPLSTTPFNDASNLLAVASVLFKRGDFKRLSGRLRPDVLWLLGIEGAEAFSESEEEEPKEVSKAFKETGYFFLRSGWGAEASYMAFDCGPHGWLNAGHAHADLLSLHVTSGEHTLIEDPGTFTYLNNGGWRDLFRGPKMHATVWINGKHPSVPEGSFHWRSVAKSIFHRFFSNPHHDYVAGSMMIDEETRLTREIHFIKPDAFLIIDRIKGKGEKEIETRFPLAHGEWTMSEGECWKTESPNGGRFIILSSAWMTAGLEASWVSPIYGRKEHAKALVLSGRSHLPAEMAYLVLTSKPAVRPDFSLHGNSFELTVGEEHWIGFARPDRATLDDDGGIESDSMAGLLRRLPSGEMVVMVLHEGTYVRMSGREIRLTSE